MRAGITAVHIGQNVRRNQPAEADASGPGILHLDPAGREVERVVDIAAEAAELTIGKHAGHPAAVEMPVIAGTDGAEPAVTTDPRTDAQREVGRRAHRVRVGIPDATAGAAEQIETGPARERS